MKLIDILRKRASDDKFEKEICTALSNKADEIIKQASAHLEYVRNVLDEFDMHNVKHSEGVLKIIEDLLGDDAEKLSSYDLFSLIAVAYLHDCGMAVSDAEINVMKLVENNKFDGKKVCTEEESKNVIECNRDNIFKSKTDAEEIKNWLFYPGSEEKLFEYYAQLLREYQDFRNGKIDVIKKSADPDKTNKELRIEYIRSKHTDRAETYIKTLGEKDNAVFPDNQPMGQLLFENIAMACKAHGEDANYLTELDKDAGYVGCESSNIQFVAMMLRIGDIVHFDYKRAPIVLRALHHFESDYSFEQWRIKTDSGVNFNTKGGVIVCNANCKAPKDYYNLMSYIDWIDHELELYNRLKRNEEWDEKYPDMPKNVDRSHMKHAKSFIPVPNLKFTLEQNKILDLLMGAKLYSNEYACLRELYQNSLDACRCQIAKDKSKGKDSKGEIEFGLTDENGERYVYCLDNGKGMSKHIIENYLLKIGSSYYKSSDFYKSQAETGNRFTPTSQFGIGILSCFMIGDRVEITTREDGKDYVSCVMENIHECFYYKKETPPKDKDKIPSSGTLIKIFLNRDYKDKISKGHLDNIGYLLWRNEHEHDKDKRIHLDHLYFILDGFVKVVPNGITLNVQIEGESDPLPIYNKPLPMGEGICTYPQNDNNKRQIERLKEIVFKELDVEHEGIRYRSYLILPTEKEPFYTPYYREILYGKDAYCVDGIKVDDGILKGDLLKVTDSYHMGGVLNYISTERPQLSVSREKIVGYNPEKYEGKIKVLLGKIVKQAIDKTAEYIAEKNVEPDSDLYMGIWNAFFVRFKDVPVDIVVQQLSGNSINFLVMPLPKDFTSSKMTFGEFWGEKVRFDNYRMFISYELMDCPKLLKQIIRNRIESSTSISFDGNNVLITGYQSNRASNINFAPSGDGLFQNYDVVTSLYPFVSNSLERFEEEILEYLYDYAECFLRIVVNRYSEERIIAAIYNFISIQENRMRINERGDNTEIYSLLSDFFNNNRTLLLNEVTSHNYRSRDFKINNVVITFFIPISGKQLAMGLYKRFWEFNYNTFDINKSDEGLSVVIFGKNDYCVLHGCWTRQELIDKIPDVEWERLSRRRYYFADGTPVRRSPRSSRKKFPFF